MPRPRRSPPGLRSDAETEDSGLERFSAVTENYLLSLYRLWEDSVTPTVTQLTEAIKQLSAHRGPGVFGALGGRNDPPDAETGLG